MTHPFVRFRRGQAVLPGGPITPAEVADVIERVITELETHGHARKTFGHSNGPKCTLGALNYTLSGSTTNAWADVLGDHMAEDRRSAVLDRSLTAILEGTRAMGLINWNDDTPTPEVIDHLKHVVKDLRNEEPCGSSG